MSDRHPALRALSFLRAALAALLSFAALAWLARAGYVFWTGFREPDFSGRLRHAVGVGDPQGLAAGVVLSVFALRLGEVMREKPAGTAAKPAAPPAPLGAGTGMLVAFAGFIALLAWGGVAPGSGGELGVAVRTLVAHRNELIMMALLFALGGVWLRFGAAPRGAAPAGAKR